MEELRLVSPGGMKTKHDDFLDTISMLGSLRVWRPSEETHMVKSDSNSPWELEDPDEDESNTAMKSYIV